MAEKIFSRPKRCLMCCFIIAPMHGIINRLVAEVIDELGILETTIGVTPVGCSTLIYEYFNFDVVEAAHGRAPAVATGV